MTFGSLFAGIGGFDLGLERAGMECRWQVEIDDYASRVLAKHWPHVARWGDVRTFPPGPADEWRVDLICAGVPCQPVSHAGKQKGADDERWMWGEALRVVADIQPAFFVAENPIGILNHDGGRTFRGLLRALASVGYVCEWHVISAADVGAPHLRQRVWLVAHADSVSRPQREPRRASECLLAESAGSQGRKNKGETRAVVGDFCSDVADANCKPTGLEKHRSSGQKRKISDSPQPKILRQAHGQACSEGARANSCDGGKDFWGRRANADAFGQWWASEPQLGRLAHGVPSRVDRLRCLGNAVVPQIVELIGRAIIEHQRHGAAES